MKTACTLATLAIALWTLAGCSPSSEGPAPSSNSAGNAPNSSGSAGAPRSTVATGQPLGSVKVGDKALCAICAVTEGTQATEEVKATLDYKGKTYAFCSESEKAEFISNPAKCAGN